MNLPCLLDDKMKPRADLHPIRLTVDRSLQPLSMAEMVLPPEDAPVCVRDFVRLCDGFGDDEITAFPASAKSRACDAWCSWSTGWRRWRTTCCPR